MEWVKKEELGRGDGEELKEMGAVIHLTNIPSEEREKEVSYLGQVINWWLTVLLIQIPICVPTKNTAAFEECIETCMKHTFCTLHFTPRNNGEVDHDILCFYGYKVI